MSASEAGNWEALAGRAQGNLERFWLEEAGWFADVLEAPEGVPAANAIRDPRLRPNQLFGHHLGLRWRRPGPPDGGCGHAPSFSARRDAKFGAAARRPATPAPCCGWNAAQ